MCFNCNNNKYYRSSNYSHDKYIKQTVIKEFAQNIVERIKDASFPHKFCACPDSNAEMMLFMEKAIEIIREEGKIYEQMEN